MSKRISKYYLCYQVAGWGLLMVPMSMFGPGLGSMIIMTVVAGMLTSHLLRSIFIRYGWLDLPMKAALPRLLVSVILACIVAGLIKRMGVYLLGGAMAQIGILRMIVADVIDYSLLLGPWTMMYFLYHYAERVYYGSSKNRKLEMRVKEMEKQSEVSGTNMEAMIDTLKRIQASIEVDPMRSRAEITEFSKVLREGYLRS